ncbi:hypothetical protein BP6252_01637 [Coleophoma cylindrospora]|uniref:Origin recognition complex subunit 2 n=1 Tax=Coleophoma cylindrospora TaxID=1849047 RepID=A0A3D8STI6_9HELO|nr:hypothetical protein BP6252_01637 [Coleophoma cylindrospora]
MKRKKSFEDVDGELSNGDAPSPGPMSDTVDVEMHDAVDGTPSKKRSSINGRTHKSLTPSLDSTGAISASRQVEENGSTPKSNTPAKKISRELARLQWESEGVKTSKARVEDTLVEDEEEDYMDELSAPDQVGTPSKRTPMRPGSASRGQGIGTTPSKSTVRKNLFSTPTKTNGIGKGTPTSTPKFHPTADRSARRKTTKSLIERTILGNTSDNEEDEASLLQDIYGSDEENDIVGGDVPGTVSEAVEAIATPSKRGRGRPPGSKSKPREPSPLPQNLGPAELYFAQNRGKVQTSNNTLTSLSLLDHEEYFSLIRKHDDPHIKDINFLQDTHAGSFNQWQFELNQDFNICIYGWGSKRELLSKFANHLYNTFDDPEKNKIVVVNGYVPTLTVKDVLNTVAAAVADRGQKLGSQPAEMLETLVGLLERDPSQHVTLMINSIDGSPLRRPSTQTVLARLASHPQISLIASADHPSFPLLWDTSLRSTYNFLFHDCTTFQPYAVEVDVVDEVNELLGRSGRRVGGKEGISFVLKSLPENAKNLFRVLVAEQLIGMSEDDDMEDDDNDKRMGNQEVGVEYRVLYNKAAEEFICSNEMNFRTLLKEFHDHQMIESRKDALGTEILSVPFRKEELETILEDIS